MNANHDPGAEGMARIQDYVSATLLVIAATFLASTVEAVEALTIVLAVGLTHGWRTALLGLAAGSIALAAVVIALGPALITIQNSPNGGLRSPGSASSMRMQATLRSLSGTSSRILKRRGSYPTCSATCCRLSRISRSGSSWMFP